MKKSAKLLTLGIVMAFLMLFSLNKKTVATSSLTQTNISFLTAMAEDEGGGTTLTGPRRVYDCQGVGSYGVTCLNEQSISCIEIPCN